MGSLTMFLVAGAIFVMGFEWHEQKNRINYAKRKVSFELACKVFDEPLPSPPNIRRSAMPPCGRFIKNSFVV